MSEAADESPSECASRVGSEGVDRYRAIGIGVEVVVAEACHRSGVAVDDAEPVGAAEVELPRWLREQAVTVTRHRHGRVPPGQSARSSVSRR